MTVDRYNALRLAVLPVFFLVLAIPALEELAAGLRRSWWLRAAAAVLVLAAGVQFAQFVETYRTRGPARLVLFDAGVPGLLSRPFAAGETIHVDFDDRGAQAQARWRAAVSGLPRARVVVLPDGAIPPPGALVLVQFQDCDYACEEVARWEGYRLMRAVGP